MTNAANDNVNIECQNEDACLDARMRRALIQAWKELRPAHRPTRPRDLISLLTYKCTWPMPEFSPRDNERFDIERNLDFRLKMFLEASSALRGSFPRSRDSYVLLELLDKRLPEGAASEIVSDRLIRLEGWLEELSAGSGLIPRPPSPRPKSVSQPHIRGIVTDVFWYMLRIEGQQPTASFAGSPPRPNSRAGIIAEATVQGLGHSVAGIKRHIEAVMKDQKWRQADFNSWETLPQAAP